MNSSSTSQNILCKFIDCAAATAVESVASATGASPLWNNKKLKLSDDTLMKCDGGSGDHPKVASVISCGKFKIDTYTDGSSSSISANQLFVAPTRAEIAQWGIETEITNGSNDDEELQHRSNPPSNPPKLLDELEYDNEKGDEAILEEEDEAIKEDHTT